MTLQQVNPIPNLTPWLVDVQEFNATIDGVRFTFRPVGRCPASTRDPYGHYRACNGIWRDYRGNSGYEPRFHFCPKKDHAPEAQTDRLFQHLHSTAAMTRERRAKDDDARAARERQEAALAAVEGIPTSELRKGIVKDLVMACQVALDVQEGTTRDNAGILEETLASVIARTGRLS